MQISKSYKRNDEKKKIRNLFFCFVPTCVNWAFEFTTQQRLRNKQSLNEEKESEKKIYKTNAKPKSHK